MQPLYEEIRKRGLAKSKREAKRLIIQGAFLVNLGIPTNPWVQVSGGDEITPIEINRKKKNSLYQFGTTKPIGNELCRFCNKPNSLHINGNCPVIGKRI